MARIRTIKPEFPQSESMGRVSRDARGHFIKRAIRAGTRRELALRHGCAPGETVLVPCHYCGKTGSVCWVIQERGAGWVQFIELEMDHVIAEFNGGSSEAENIVLACRTCNRSKGHK